MFQKYNFGKTLDYIGKNKQKPRIKQSWLNKFRNITQPFHHFPVIVNNFPGNILR